MSTAVSSCSGWSVRRIHQPGRVDGANVIVRRSRPRPALRREAHFVDRLRAEPRKRGVERGLRAPHEAAGRVGEACGLRHRLYFHFFGSVGFSRIFSMALDTSGSNWAVRIMSTTVVSHTPNPPSLS